MYFLRRIFNADFRAFDKSYIHTVPIPKNTVADIQERTSYTVDISHPKQTGLTMRTIEMIGLRRKMITTNEDIRHYDFYNPVNQIIIDRKKLTVPDISLDQTYVDVAEEVYRKYSLESWLNDLLG